jgi:hypothetical protein
MKVRYACSIDVPALAELGKRAHAETRFSVYDYSMTRITENLLHLIEIGQNERGTNCLLIAEDEGVRDLRRRYQRLRHTSQRPPADPHRVRADRRELQPSGLGQEALPTGRAPG